mmetsp:Transcript_17111/g.25927  ORF Transcript_17111/g.25927 Transcript_17111/m.25927 type:complete len:264 (-) Transcript_17111:57-848(-)|eukprot:CAMPEP_0178921432 /NCGR_PEP_ID=MMETSP0786-20121207/15559_1 /TAXON_ID=186022 /ORGANISM="Thalassionema frauenfeldii, Strain CCMP 1798" /LENGTH=263 /DNA_ID=CAMNT_0020595613 /DNA_START=87 /DNA_END=878 /DNA_ORIENTATION=+
MGGDGGVIASNRRYMRGAGTANCTADNANYDKKEADKHVVHEIMTLCYLTKLPLQFSTQDIVVDPYGRLYHKEQAVEALLRRKTHRTDELGEHIRGLKDLKVARFHLQDGNKPTCPITNVELNGSKKAFLLPNSTNENINVISERAIQEMGAEALSGEYGDDILSKGRMIQLAPPPSKMEEIQETVRLTHEQEKIAAKKKSKKNKKRKRENQGDKTSRPAGKNIDSTQSIRERVDSSVKTSKVLSSLFTTGTKKSADDLFARS